MIVIFDVDMSYHIVLYHQKNNKFFYISCYLLYITIFSIYIAIFYARSLYFYYCITKI